MKPELFERELRYQTVLAICQSLRQRGVLSGDDLAVAEQYLCDKYRPLFPLI